tara:strand:+ start:851 stop:994 length:144 start_codon:yes stop_codon:yes gene_type:complete
MWFFIRPIVIRYRKYIAKKKGVEYKPLFPKVIDRVDNFKIKIKKKNG